MIFLVLTSDNSLGIGTSGTKGTLATFICLFAKYILSGVLDVLDIPTRTKSALRTPLGSLPSSYLTANSIASILLKYDSSSFLIIPGSLFGFFSKRPLIFLSISDIRSIELIPSLSENSVIISHISSSTNV